MSEWQIFLLRDLNVLWREVGPPWWKGRLTQCLCAPFGWLAEKRWMHKYASYVDNISPVRPPVWAKVWLRQLWLCVAIGRRRRSPVFNLKVLNQFSA